MVTIGSIDKDRWPRQGGCYISYPCQVGGQQAEQSKSQPARESGHLALILDDRREHLSGLGQAWRVQLCMWCHRLGAIGDVV